MTAPKKSTFLETIGTWRAFSKNPPTFLRHDLFERGPCNAHDLLFTRRMIFATDSNKVKSRCAKANPNQAQQKRTKPICFEMHQFDSTNTVPREFGCVGLCCLVELGKAIQDMHIDRMLTCHSIDGIIAQPRMAGGTSTVVEKHNTIQHKSSIFFHVLDFGSCVRFPGELVNRAPPHRRSSVTKLTELRPIGGARLTNKQSSAL